MLTNRRSYRGKSKSSGEYPRRASEPGTRPENFHENTQVPARDQEAHNHDQTKEGIPGSVGEARIDMDSVIVKAGFVDSLNIPRAASPIAIASASPENATQGTPPSADDPDCPPPASAPVASENPPKGLRTANDYRYEITNNGQHWQACMAEVQAFDEMMCRGWKEEIDTLLVFAGLFSAAVTAFTVESYQWLKADPNDVIIRALSQISLQLGNSSTTVTVPPPESFVPSQSSVRINIFWFLSLTLSLTSVLVGILCKQWIREYQQHTTTSYQMALTIRQMRYKALLKWKVPEIVTSLPLLLQLALVFFFAGLLDLLWGLHRAVGVAVSVVIGMSVLGLIITTALPGLQLSLYQNPYTRPTMCAYRSPQSQLFHRVSTLFTYTKSSWMAYDIESLGYYHNANTYIAQAMAWLDTTFSRSVDMGYYIFHCLGDLDDDAAIASMIEIYDLRGDGGEAVDDLLEAGSKSAENTTENFLKDIITALYLAPRQMDSAIAETCLRVISTSTGQLPDGLFWKTMKCLSGSWMPDEVRVLTLEAVIGALSQDRVGEGGIIPVTRFIGKYATSLSEAEIAPFLEHLAKAIPKYQSDRRIRTHFWFYITLLALKPVIHIATIRKFVQFLDQLPGYTEELHLDRGVLERWKELKDKYLKDTDKI